MASSLTDHTILPPTPPSEPMANTSSSATTTPATMNVSTPLPATTQHKHIWVITGPAGCGKTSVAEYLHRSFGFPYLEGDSFHTPANIEKMAAGHPLTDADRWDWLITLREQAILALSSSSSSSPETPSSPGVLVTCSALKRKYRDVVRVAAYHRPEIRIHFIYLRASEAVLMDRVRARTNHYMKDYMVHSQFESLEAPATDEDDVLAVDATGTSSVVQELAGRTVEGVMRGDVSRD